MVKNKNNNLSDEDNKLWETVSNKAVKYKKTNIAPEFAIPNPSSTYNSGSIALGGESKINTMNTINNIRYICFPILLNL